jgi:hypothetical protein
MMTAKQSKPKFPKLLTVKLSAEEREELETLRAKRGLKAASELVRLLVREDMKRQEATA